MQKKAVSDFERSEISKIRQTELSQKTLSFQNERTNCELAAMSHLESSLTFSTNLQGKSKPDNNSETLDFFRNNIIFIVQNLKTF